MNRDSSHIPALAQRRRFPLLRTQLAEERKDVNSLLPHQLPLVICHGAPRHAHATSWTATLSDRPLRTTSRAGPAVVTPAAVTVDWLTRMSPPPASPAMRAAWCTPSPAKSFPDNKASAWCTPMRSEERRVGKGGR